MADKIVAPQLAEEFVIPHAVVYETESGWQQRAERERFARSKKNQTSIFAMDGKYYVIGDEALNSGEVFRQTGQSKYIKGYFDVLVMAGLLKVLPEGHNNIVLACANAANSTPFITDMWNAVKNKHKVSDPSGVTRTYNIAHFLPWDEPAGGLWRFLSVDNNINNFPPGTRACIIDIGGKVSSMNMAVLQNDGSVEIYWDEGITFDLGVQDILGKMQTELWNADRDTFRVRAIPEDMLRQCLLNQGMMQVGGDEYDARVPYRNAMGPVMQKLLSHWKNKMLGGLNVDIVLVSGGGGGLSYTTFVEKLGHNHIYLADDIATINLANLRGSVVAAQQWCIANRGKLPDRGGQMPVLVSIDPGNADIKVTLVGDV